MIPIVEGEDIRKVTSDVNSLMQADIDSGELPNSEFRAMVETATEKYKACLN